MYTYIHMYTCQASLETKIDQIWAAVKASHVS